MNKISSFDIELNNALKEKKDEFITGMDCFLNGLKPNEWFMLSDYKIPVYKEDLSSIMNKVKQIIESEENFTYSPIVNSLSPISINFKLDNIYPDNGAPTERYKDFIVNFHNWNYECEEMFWQNHSRCQFLKISNFDCYVDLNVLKSELAYATKDYYKPDVSGWELYFEELLKVHFSEFSEVKEKGQKVFRHKKINDRLWLGLTYKKSSLKKSITKDMDLPRDLEIGFSLDSGKTINSLGPLQNPLFRNPGFKLGAFASIEMYHNGSNFQSIELNYKPKIVDNGKTYSIIFSKSYGEKLKRYAYYSLYMLSLSSSEYMKYLEKSLLAAASLD